MKTKIALLSMVLLSGCGADVDDMKSFMDNCDKDGAKLTAKLSRDIWGGEVSFSCTWSVTNENE